MYQMELDMIIMTNFNLSYMYVYIFKNLYWDIVHTYVFIYAHIQSLIFSYPRIIIVDGSVCYLIYLATFPISLLQ
jgi:hypothetical protein